VGGQFDHPPRPATRADKIAGSDFEQPQAGPKGEGQVHSRWSQKAPSVMRAAMANRAWTQSDL
jgi:hypothetical protein